MVNSQGNNKKFYKLALDENPNLAKTYGRVGSAGVTEHETGAGVRGFERLMNAKIRKGCKLIKVANEPAAPANPQKLSLQR